MQQTHGATKNVTFSKAGITLTCWCGETDTYQIGQMDKDKWANEGVHTRHKYWCRNCRGRHMYEHLAEPREQEIDDIDKLMELI